MMSLQGPSTSQASSSAYPKDLYLLTLKLHLPALSVKLEMLGAFPCQYLLRP